MKKKKSKKSKISMQNNELFEGREKKKKARDWGSSTAGRVFKGPVLRVTLEWGLQTVWVVVITG